MANPPINSLFDTNLGSVSSLNMAGVSVNGAPVVPSTLPAIRYLPLTLVSADNGLPLLTATAASTLPGIARTAGTSMNLTGVATSGATPATTKMIWEFDLPDTYVAGANIPVLVTAVVTPATNVTAASTTMTVSLYTVSPLGVEVSKTVSAAQQIAITTASTLTFTVTGTGLVPGQRVVLELVALVTTTVGGASTVAVNSVGYSA